MGIEKVFDVEFAFQWLKKGVSSIGDGEKMDLFEEREKPKERTINSEIGVSGIWQTMEINKSIWRENEM